MKRLWVWLGVVVWAAGCGTEIPVITPATPAFSLPTAGPLPPTFTPPGTAVSGPTATTRPQSTPADTATPIDFDQTAVELRYAIPAIGLDRRLQGNIASQIVVVDETTGEARQYNNQAAILLELQQALPDLALEPVPDGCDRCVRVSYSLPLAGQSGEGWLQDGVLLASIENFMSVRLGPYFPPDARLGLRRGASPYAPAHTLVVTADGRLWRWLATDVQLPEPVDAATVAPNLLLALNALPLDELDDRYLVDCAGTPIETLLVGVDRPLIRLSCPEFALPNTLLPLYLALDVLLAPTIAEVSVHRPPAAFPLDAVLDYERADEMRLTMFWDGRIIFIDASSTVYTSTVTIPETISLTTSLLDSGHLQPGLTTFLPAATPVVTATADAAPVAFSRLLVRGPNGVYDARWPGIPDLAELNALLDALLPEPAIVPAP